MHTSTIIHDEDKQDEDEDEVPDVQAKEAMM